MNTIDIRKLDMTLLLVFQEVMRHRKLTAVAERLGLTQSSISHSLRRLRDVFGDELFLRRSNGVEPTARARELEPVVRGVIETLRGAIRIDEPFAPESVRGVVRISMVDHYCALVGAPLLRAIRQSAPNLQLSIRPLVRRAALGALAANDIDLALGLFWKLPKGLRGQKLFEETHRVVARKGHPLIRQKLDLKTFLAAEHLLVSFGGDLEGVVDQALAKLGKQRKLVAAMPFFLPAIATVAKTDLITTVPSRHALAFAETFRLNVYAPPIQIPRYMTGIVWHERNDGNALIRWTIGQLADVLASRECGGDGTRRASRRSRETN
jgi:DNA-binding transcriptional LysR family regulator